MSRIFRRLGFNGPGPNSGPDRGICLGHRFITRSVCSGNVFATTAAAVPYQTSEKPLCPRMYLRRAAFYNGRVDFPAPAGTGKSGFVTLVHGGRKSFSRVPFAPGESGRAGESGFGRCYYGDGQFFLMRPGARPRLVAVSAVNYCRRARSAGPAATGILGERSRPPRADDYRDGLMYCVRIRMCTI